MTPTHLHSLVLMYQHIHNYLYFHYFHLKKKIVQSSPLHTYNYYSFLSRQYMSHPHTKRSCE